MIPGGIGRYRIKNGLELKTMKRFLILLAVLCPTLVFGQAISYRALNLSQFYSNAYTVGIKSGALITNVNFWGTSTFNGAVAVDGTLTADSFSIATNLYGNTTSVNFNYSRATTNLAGNLTFAAGLLNFNATNYNDIILHCYGDGGDRTITAPTEWGTTRAAHVVTNGQWSAIWISAQIGQFTNMSQIDYP